MAALLVGFPRAPDVGPSPSVGRCHHVTKWKRWRLLTPCLYVALNSGWQSSHPQVQYPKRGADFLCNVSDGRDDVSAPWCVLSRLVGPADCVSCLLCLRHLWWKWNFLRDAFSCLILSGWASPCCVLWLARGDRDTPQPCWLNLCHWSHSGRHTGG